MAKLFKEFATALNEKTSFQAIPMSADSETIEQGQNSLVLIKFTTVVAGYPISDCFLWPRSCRSVPDIKIFATDLLSDIFGPKFGAFDPREVECKFSVFADDLQSSRLIWRM